MMDMEKTRYNMIEQQIRTWEVLDQQVLDLLSEIRREDFVLESNKALAFVDMELPIGLGEVMLAPRVEARLLQSVNVKKTDKVLEVGTGTGYMTALLATQGRHVYSVDLHPEFSAIAERNLAQYQIENVTLEVGNAAQGWDKHGPYDVIVLTGSLPVLPQKFLDSLNVGGRLIAVVGDVPVMIAQLMTCVESGVFQTVNVFDTVIPPLKNATQPQRFVF